MNVQFGNLELKNVVKEEHLAVVQTFLDENGYTRTEKCDDIKHGKGNYHIFDIPRLITICDENKMKEFISFVKDNDLVEKAFIGSIGVTYIDYKQK